MNAKHDEQLVVTGTGLVTPYGIGFDPVLAAVEISRPAWREMTAFDCTSWPVRHGGWIDDPTPEQLGTFNNKLRNMGKYVRLGVIAARQALNSAGITTGSCPPERQGAFICTGTYGHNAEGLFPAFAESAGENGALDLQRLGESGVDRVHPWWLLSTISNNLIFFVTHFFQLKGPNSNYCNAPMAGVQALARACEALREGEVDVALVGGADAPLNWQLMSDLYAMNLLAESGPGDPPEPFSSAARGMVLSDGAGFLVVERLSHARARGAKPLALIGDLACAATHADLIHPPEDGETTAQVFRTLLKDFDKEKIVQVYLAGVGHPIWDTAELNGLAAADARELGSRLVVSCPKRLLGHAFSVSFIVESICAIEALAGQLGFPPGEAADRLTATGMQSSHSRQSHQCALVTSLCFGGDAAGVIYHGL